MLSYIVNSSFVNETHNPLQHALNPLIHFEDKVHNDPIRQTYNRAYKAHCAWKMKKKMTLTEFEKWSAYALELRGKAERNEITFEDYEREIKK